MTQLTWFIWEMNIKEAARLDNACLVTSLLDEGCSKREHFTAVLQGTPLQEHDAELSSVEVHLEAKT